MTEASDDTRFLDDLFDDMLTAAQTGAGGDWSVRLVGREHLRTRADDLWRLAQSVATAAVGGPPTECLTDFTVVRELGRGTSSVVYLARQSSVSDRLVALKLLHQASGERDRQRLAAEVRALARVRHPHVVPIHGVVEHQGLCGFAMEWVEGHPLSELIRQRAQLTAATADESTDAGHAALPRARFVPFVCRLGIAIGRALSAVHEQGLLHRDVKPSNVLLRADGTPLLTDFGLVRDDAASLHTRTGAFLGTLAYAAPEQIRGEAIDVRADVYGLGATLYHALTLQPPVRGSSTVAVLRWLEAGRVPALRAVDPRLPADLDKVVGKAMAPALADRYASAAELADDLQRVLDLQPVSARRPSLWRRSWQALRRHRRVVASAAVGALLVVAASAGWWWFDVRRRAHAAQAAAHVQSARLALLDPGLRRRVRARIEADVNPRLDLVERAVEQALRHYDAALESSVPAGAVVLERHTLAACLDRLRGRQVQVAAALRQRCPRTAQMLAGGDAEAADNGHDWSTVSATDLRTFGIASYLCGSLAAATAALEQLGAQDEVDVLVDGLLGQVHLVADRPQLAYPRLLRASQALPQRGSLRASAIAAAIACGDGPVARRLLALPDSSDDPVPPAARALLTADLDWITGGGARAALPAYKQAADNERLCAVMVELGYWQMAVPYLVNEVGLRPHGLRARRLLLLAVDRWWQELDRERRLTFLCDGLAGRPCPVGNLCGVLACAQVVCRALAARSEAATAAAPFTVDGVERAWTAEVLASQSALHRLLRRVDFTRIDFARCMELDVPTRRELADCLLDPAADDHLPAKLQRLGVWLADGRDAFTIDASFAGGPLRLVAEIAAPDWPITALWGRPCAPLHDVDGDGQNDFALHLHRAPGLANGLGLVRVLSGRDGSSLAEVRGEDPADAFGSTLSSLGDVTGDGVADWVARAGGELRVVDGAAHRVASRWRRPLPGFGHAVAWLEADDGVGRLAVAAPLAGDVASHAGSVLLLRVDGAVVAQVDGDGEFDAFGQHLAAVGDIDGDGFGDLAVGTEAQSHPPYAVVLSGRDGSVRWRFDDDRFQHKAPVAVGAIGDVDGDGRADVLVGITSLLPWDHPEGYVAVLSGGDGSTLLEVHNRWPADGFGEHVAGLGDLDGDGCPEFVVTAACEASTRPVTAYVFDGHGRLLAQLPGVFRLERLPGAGSKRLVARTLRCWTRYGAEPIGSGVRVLLLEWRGRTPR